MKDQKEASFVVDPDADLALRWPFAFAFELLFDPSFRKTVWSCCWQGSTEKALCCSAVVVLRLFKCLGFPWLWVPRRLRDCFRVGEAVLVASLVIVERCCCGVGGDSPARPPRASSLRWMLPAERWRRDLTTRAELEVKSCGPGDPEVAVILRLRLASSTFAAEEFRRRIRKSVIQ